MRTNKIFTFCLAVITVAAAFLMLCGTAMASRDFEIANSSGTILYVNGTTANIGVGTSKPQGAFVVINGNTGIGTWAPSQLLEIGKQKVDMTSNGNVGIGTILPTGALEIEGGNVGINTAITSNNALTVFGGNIGIGTTAAPSAVYVSGMAETTGFKMNNAAVSGYVLVGNGVGIGTWMPTGTLSISANPGGSVPQLQYDNGGILAGVPLSGADANGNLGIGTIGPMDKLAVAGNVGIGTQSYSKYITTAPTAFGLAIEGNAGIGTWMVDNAGLAVIGRNVGIGTWAPSAVFQVGAYVSSDNGLMVDTGGNVGMGTTLTSTAALSVMSGNVGIGTWVGSTVFQVGKLKSSNSGFGADANGNLGLGTTLTSLASLTVMTGNTGIGTWIPNAALVVNGNLGVGTAFANNAFETIGTGEMTGFKMNNKAVSGYVMVANSVGLGTWMPSTTLNASPTSAPAGNVPQLQYNNGGSLGGIAGSGVDLSGNIGVGTSGPMEKLAVAGNVGIGTQAYSKYITTTPTAGGLVLEGNAGIGTWNVDNAGLSVIGDSVGIGTWVPGLILQVASGNSSFGVDANGNMGIGTLLISQAALSVMDGNMGIGTWVPSAMLQVGRYRSSSIGFAVDANGNVGIGTIMTASAALTVLNGNVGIGTWVPGAALIVNGNVSVGTANASNTLEVGGSAQMTGFKMNNNASSGYVMVSNAIGAGTWMPSSTLNAAVPTSPGGSVPQLQYNNNGALGGVAGSGADTNGNVGLGTFGPREKLAIVSNIGIGTQIYSNYVTIAAPSGGEIIEGNAGIGTYLPAQMFEAGIQDLDIVSNGNVGIGTPAPTGFEVEGRNLGINTASTASNALTVFGGSVGIGTITAPNSLYVKGVAEMTGFKMNNNGGSGYVLISNGVGLGTWMASTTLTVNATPTPGGSAPQLQYNNNGGMAGVANSGADANGNVGIGTSGPLAKLAVVGNIGIGTESYSNYITATPSSNGLVLEGNVGVGTWKIDKAGLGILRGNVGIGTWVPVKSFQVGPYSPNTSGFMVDASGNVGLGTVSTSGAGLTVMNANVGIGTWLPGNSLDVVLGNIGISFSAGHVINVRDVNGNVASYLSTNADSSSLYLGYQAATSVAATNLRSVAVGDQAQNALTTGTDNTAVGAQALLSNTIKPGNTAVGYQALINTFSSHAANTDAENNIGLGLQAGYSNTTGSNNVFVGYGTDWSSTGSNIVNAATCRFGLGLCPTTVTANNYVAIGYGSLVGTTDTNEIVIGYVVSGLGPNTAKLGGDSSDTIVGLATTTTELNGNVGINTSHPNYNLQISGCTSKNSTLSCVDMAEIIPSSQAVSAGDIVMLDPSKPVTVMKAATSSPFFLKRGSGGVTEILFGVVSTDPAIVIEGKILGVFDGKGYTLNPTKPAVALAGRVPVKVNLENGPILEGDMITASSSSGIGTKATRPSKVIGMALEPMNDLKGGNYQKIYVYVNPHWWGGGLGGDLDRLLKEDQDLLSRRRQADEEMKNFEANLTELEKTVKRH